MKTYKAHGTSATLFFFNDYGSPGSHPARQPASQPASKRKQAGRSDASKQPTSQPASQLGSRAAGTRASKPASQAFSPATDPAQEARMCEDFLKKNHPTPKKNPAVVHAEKKPVHARKIPHPRQKKTFQIQLKPRRKKTFNLGFVFGVPVHAEIEPGHAEIICSPF